MREAIECPDAGDAPERVAYHKAGHAVIARVLDFPCGHATIVPDEGAAGHAIIGDQWEAIAQWEILGRWRDEVTALRARVMVYMAGAEAEAEFIGACLGGDHDLFQIVLMLDYMLPGGADLLSHEARLRRFTRAMVRRHRDKIEAVARQLLRRKHLSAERIDALVFQGTPSGAGGE